MADLEDWNRMFEEWHSARAALDALQANIDAEVKLCFEGASSGPSKAMQQEVLDLRLNEAQLRTALDHFISEAFE